MGAVNLEPLRLDLKIHRRTLRYVRSKLARNPWGKGSWNCHGFGQRGQDEIAPSGACPTSSVRGPPGRVRILGFTRRLQVDLLELLCGLLRPDVAV